MTVSRSSGGPARHRAGPLLFWALVVAGVPARALGAREVELSASAGLTRIAYEELGPFGDFLDSEEGWLPTLTGRVELRWGRLYAEAGGAVAAGELAYLGRVQGGSSAVRGLEARSVSDAVFLSADARGGVFLDRGGRLALVVGGAARRWERTIRGTTVTSRTGVPTPIPGLAEVYSWYEVHAGANATLVATERVAWRAHVLVSRTVEPSMEVAWNGRDVPLALGPRTGWIAGTRVQLAVGPRAFVAAGASAEWYAFDASAVTVVDGAALREPDSTTLGVLLELGAGVRF